MKPLTCPILTERLRLEPVTHSLAEAARAGGDAFAQILGATAPPEWRQASLALVARSTPLVWGPVRLPVRAIAIHRADGAVVGDVRFEPSFRAPREVEIGYSVAKSRRGLGYAVEAAGALIDWLFAEGDVDSIIAGCDKANVASVRTLRRLGFWLDSNPGQTFWWGLTADLRSATRA